MMQASSLEAKPLNGIRISALHINILGATKVMSVEPYGVFPPRLMSLVGQDVVPILKNILLSIRYTRKTCVRTKKQLWMRTSLALVRAIGVLLVFRTHSSGLRVMMGRQMAL
jgi:hypothetical protein